MARPRTDPAIRFAKFVDVVEGGCHEWTSTLNNGGYGKFFMPELGQAPAHRVAYMMHKGEIPLGLCVCHTCDNRKCVNPDHLFLGSHSDNARDMVRKGRYWGSRKVADREAALAINLYRHRKFSQQSIAKIIGVTQSSVSKIVLGQVDYSKRIQPPTGGFSLEKHHGNSFY
ncbi:HNH endonuclease [Pusillimonas sp. SM2304]|uniref:HNH endonuclease n=1 Tax=Pusillimonas sp. SM2304 TaxID=3073241 RepID=UPI002874D0EB|nr:HNH endonuclease [Pusillimonas sp. SM2304]MDS1142395.1 HNH endonuclease [Pusillimonas sp. SM2304]